MLADEVVDCHVLVIGSGGAGVRAAIEASQYGDVVLISKTLVGKGVSKTFKLTFTSAGDPTKVDAVRDVKVQE